jgi:peroxiredoxin
VIFPLKKHTSAVFSLSHDTNERDKKKIKKIGGNSSLMSFKHLRMINSASKCLQITLKVIKFSKPETNFLIKHEGDIPP